MTLITSRSTEDPAMTDQIATEDITGVNALGQTVLLVPKGQPIPEHLQDKAAPPVQDKARRSSRQKAQES